MLTSKSCSEKGLEDATALLLHLSSDPSPVQNQVMPLLMQGASTLGTTVVQHTEALLKHLSSYNASHPAHSQDDAAAYHHGTGDSATVFLIMVIYCIF